MLVELPDNIWLEAKADALGLSHGKIIIELHIRDSNLHRYEIIRSKSTLYSPTKPEGDLDNTRNYSTNTVIVRKVCRKTG